MTIYVDKLVRWPHKPKPGLAERYFGNGKPSCHLTTDGDISELHEFAARLGLHISWFQPESFPHYDLTPGKRALALRLGAVEKLDPTTPTPDPEPLSPEVQDIARTFYDDLIHGRCPVCHEVPKRQVQVGRSVYAEPCGHRMGQGKARNPPEERKPSPQQGALFE